MGTEKFTLPDEIPANEYLNLEVRQISTSRNWAIWLHEYLENFEPDFLRYYLCSIMPETRDSEFKWKEFQERVNQELINNLGNFVNRTLKFIDRYNEGIIPKPGKLSKEDKEMISKVNSLIDKLDASLSKFNFRQAVRLWMQISTTGNRYYDQTKPWENRKKDPQRMATTIYLCSHLTHVLGTIGKLFIPFTADKIFSLLKLEEKEWAKLKEIELPEDHKAGKIEPLFKKIEDTDIEKQLRRLNMTHITIDDFTKMGLKVGIIEKVEDVQGADKLYKLTVNTGEKRTLVAGVKEQYTPEQLLNKKIVVITNLEPATIRGIKSEGMLLAASSGDKISIISPDSDVPAGAKVS
jgi:methionyl-tRNA synthetase